MAYFNQEMKTQLAPAIKALCVKYGIKATLSVKNHMSFNVNISAGSIDFLGNYNAQQVFRPDDRHYMESYMRVNEYYIHDNFTGNAREFLLELKRLMMIGNHDNSDIMSDYFDIGWYIDINIGQWNKPYNCSGVVHAIREMAMA